MDIKKYIGNHHPIAIFKDNYSKEILDLISYEDLPKHFIENDVDKLKRKAFIFSTIIKKEGNEILNGINYTASPWCIVDIDIKDTNRSFFEQDFHNLQDLYNLFEKDKHCFLVGHSSSGKGLRAIYCLDCLVNDEKLFNSNFIDDNYNIEIEPDINKWKYNYFITYLKSIGLKNCGKTSNPKTHDSYLDLSFQRNHVQKTFTINGNYPYNFNMDFELIGLPPRNEIIKAVLNITEKKKTYINITPNYTDWDWNVIRVDMAKTKLISFGYYEILKWLGSLNRLSKEDPNLFNLVWFDCFVWLRNNFVGKSKNKYVKDRNVFLKSINSNSWKPQKSPPFDLLLKIHGIKITKIKPVIEYDKCNRLYDKVYE